MGLFDWLRETITGEGRDWTPSDPHNSDTFGGRKHFDVERRSEDGKVDKSAGKLHITGDPHAPSMTDIHKP